MASNATELKPKRTPIVLNMHLLYKDEGKKNKDAKEIKNAAQPVKEDPDKNKAKPVEAKPAEPSTVDVKKETNGRNGVEKDEQDPTKNVAVAIKGQNEKVCRDYRRNICTRGDKCKFFHPPQPNTSAAVRRRNSWLVLCHDFQNGQCTRSDCRYFHITRDDENLYNTTGDIHPLVVDQVMRKAYHLDIFRSGTRPPCREFLRGTCDLSTCKYRHLNRREYEDEVFHSLQDEFELVFGPPERRGTADLPPREPYPLRYYQDPTWGYEHAPQDHYDQPPLEPAFSRPAHDFHDNVGHEDLRATLMPRNEYEPDLKRRRRYSNEGYFTQRGGYEEDHRRWPEGKDCDRSYVGVDPTETDRIMREITSLRNENMELRREFEQQIITLKDQVNVLTDENASLRHENSVLRTSMNEADAVKKAAVDKLMLANDALTADNRQIKNNLLKLEHENLELKKKNDKKFDDLEKEKEEVKRSLARARELEQKAREELQKLRNEKEVQAKIAAKAEPPKTAMKADTNSVKIEGLKNQDQNQNKDRMISPGNSSGIRGFGSEASFQRQNNTNAPKGHEGYGANNRSSGMRSFNNDNKQSNWSNNSWNNQSQRSDSTKSPWENQQQQSSNDRQSGSSWLNPQQQQQVKKETAQAQSLLGEYVKPPSLLGEYGPAAGRVLIGKRTDIVAKENQNTPLRPDTQPQPTGNLHGSNLKDNLPQPTAPLRGPNFTNSQSQPAGHHRGPNFDTQSQPAGNLRGSSLKDNQPPSASSLRGPNFSESQPQSGGNGNFRGSNYDNQSQATGNYRGPNYRDNQPQSANTLRGPNFSDNQSQGVGNYRGSSFGDSHSQNAGNYRGSNYSGPQSKETGNYRGSNFSDVQSQGAGNYRGSNFSDTQSQGPGNFRSSFSDGQSQGAGNYHGSSYSDSQQPSAGSQRGPNESSMSSQYSDSSSSRYRFEDRSYSLRDDLRDNRDYGLRSDRDYGLAGYDRDMGDMRSSYSRGSDSRPPPTQSSQWGSSSRSGYNY